MTVFNYEPYQTVFYSVSYSWTPETARQLFLGNKEPMKVLKVRKVNSFHSSQLRGRRLKMLACFLRPSDPHLIQRIHIKSRECESSDLALILRKEKPASKRFVTSNIEANSLLPWGLSSAE